MMRLYNSSCRQYSLPDGRFLNPTASIEMEAHEIDALMKRADFMGHFRNGELAILRPGQEPPPPILPAAFAMSAVEMARHGDSYFRKGSIE